MAVFLLLQLLSLLAPWNDAPMPAPPAFRAKTLAVLNFDNNTGKPDYDPMGRGIAAMMITDLATSPELKLVEREKMQDILDEQKLSRSPMFDSTTAAKVGRLLGAEFIVTGSIAAATPEMRIDMRVIKVETGQIVKTAHAAGNEDKFFEIEQHLADDVLKDLDIALSPESAALLEKRREADRQLGIASFKALSSAFVAIDKRDFTTAITQLQPIVMRSPDSRVVQFAYQEAKHRAAEAAKDAATKKAGDFLKGLFPKKPQ